MLMQAQAQSRAAALDEMFPGTVSTTDAARRAGVTYRQLNYWIATKAVYPAHGNGGSGNPYRMTERQVQHLCQIGILYRLFTELDIAGPTVEFIGRVWDSLEATGSFRCTHGPLVIQLPWPPDTELLPAGA